ncbi:hypothetical protein PENTCL1PPCAC_13548, partial [Pristionchus entomophagus]
DKKQSRPNITAGRMSFFYDNKTNSLQLGDDQLKKGLERLAEQTPKNPIKGKDEGIAVPLWSIIAVGALVGALMAGNCIFFNMLRQINAKTHPADDKKSGKSASASGKASGGSKRSTSEKNKKDKVSAGSSSKSSSKSVKKSAKKAAKKNESCRSSKSLSTKSCASAAGPTSVKVVAVAPPKKETTPLPKDEVATLMQTRGGTAALPERSLDRRIEMPMTEEEFILAMKRVIEFVISYYRNPNQYPVSSAIRPNDIFNQLPQRAPDDPERFEHVWHDFHEIILKGCLHWQHPRFHAFFPCGRSYPDILAETIISSLGTVGFTWSANPAITELDTAMVNWTGRALGIPEPFLFRGTDTSASEGGGWIADTASDAIFCAIMAARNVKIEEVLTKLKVMEDKPITESTRHISKRYEKRAEILSKLVAYGSYESHSSFEKACKMACVRCRPIKVFEEHEWGMKRADVEKEMDKDVQRGLIPFYLHCALGTTSTATSDHLAELTPLKEKHKVWIHVDAAYAGSAWVVEKYRKNEGLDKVDSININLHKFFLTSTSVTLFWTKRQRDYKECFRIDPAYLKKKSGANDNRDWGIPLSRRFKSLKVYMLLRMYGLNGMRAYVTRLIEMTEYMETLVTKIPHIRKFGKTNYALFCVQYHEEGMAKEQVNAATNRLCQFINDSHKMVLTHSNVRGHDILRIAVTLERSTKKDIEESVAIFIQLLEEFKKKKAADANFLGADMSSTSKENLLQDVDMGIVGSPNPTLSKKPTNVKSTISGESLVGPRTAASHLHSALTSATQASTMVPSRTVTSPVPLTNISALTTVQLEAPPATHPAAPAANKMPPLALAFEDPSSKSGGTSSYNAPVSEGPRLRTPPPPPPPPA